MGNVFLLVYSGGISLANYLPNVDLYARLWFESLSNADFEIQYLISAVELDFASNCMFMDGGFPPNDIFLAFKPQLGGFDRCIIRLLLCTSETKHIMRLLRSIKIIKLFKKAPRYLLP